ncbi:adenylyl-sulfate kinase [Pseudoduganella eburnea]|uniref:Adenylyl-sulfate kinase n=1 Tax=Massilia eburnea TaxID=1776165 RepID=A0A6L6QKZ9_9BURK|nr:adenylyl-sulfate kinase [Massilia eburnea]MTW12336.1 adenylyl-sulfate kinase [Massilia eburnea]
MDSFHVSRRQREEMHGHRGAVVWFTGLSGAGKTTLAHALEQRLFQSGCQTVVLDGDRLRQGLCAGLGFSPADRSENIRRAGEAARLFAEAGIIVLAALISPLRADRARVREMQAEGDFIEAWCQCPLEVCELRDVKGLYRRARAGEVAQFTGISAPYEAPLAPELSLDTARCSLDECVELVLDELFSRGVLSAPGSSSFSRSRQMRAAWSPSSSSACQADTDTASKG